MITLTLVLAIALVGVTVIAFRQARTLEALAKRPLPGLEKALKKQEKNFRTLGNRLERDSTFWASQFKAKFSQDFSRFETSMLNQLRNLVELQQSQVRVFSDQLIRFSQERKAQWAGLRNESRGQLQLVQRAIHDKAVEQKEQLERLGEQLKITTDSTELQEKLKVFSARVEEMRSLNSRVEMLQFYLEKASGTGPQN